MPGSIYDIDDTPSASGPDFYSDGPPLAPQQGGDDPLAPFRMSGAPSAAAPGGDQKRTPPPAARALTPKRTSAQVAAAAPPKAAPTWGQVPGQALNNFLPDLGEAIRGVGAAVTHPGETWDAMKGVVQGVGSQVYGKMGFQKDPAQAKNEALARTAEAPYKATYGPLLQYGLTDEGTAGLRTALAEHPFGTVTDIASLATLGGGGLGAAAKGAEAAGMARTASVLGKAGNAARVVGSAIDPTENMLRVAKGAANVPGMVMRGVNSAATSVPMDYYRLAAKAGNDPFSANGRAFLGANLGLRTPTQTAMDMRNALGAAKNAGQAGHSAAMEAAAANGVQPSFDPIFNTIAAQRAELNKVPQSMYPDARQALDEVEQAAMEHQQAVKAGDPGAVGPMGMDAFKQGLYDKILSTPNPTAKNALWDIYHQGVKKSLTDAVPGYQDLMEASQQGMDRINDVEKTLALGKKSASSRALRSSLKQSATEKGRGLIDELAQHDSTIPYQLAGHATSELGAHTLLDSVLAAPAAMALGSPMGGLTPFLATSPKLMGLGHYVAGAAGSAGRQAARAGRWGSYPAQALSAASPVDPTAEAPATPQGAPQDVADAVMRTEGTDRNTKSSATGPGQFITGAFVDSVKKYHPEIAQGLNDQQIAALHGTPQGDALQADMSPKLDRDNASMLQAQGISPTPGRIKLAHMLGPSGVRRFFSAHDMNAPAEQYISPDAVAANASVFRGKTVGEVEQWAEDLMQGASRPGRASGGKISDVRRHEYLVNRLLTAAKDAKKATDKATETLLNVPDEHIVKALDVAQRAI